MIIKKESDFDSDKHSDTDCDNHTGGLFGSRKASTCLLTTTMTETVMMTLTVAMKMVEWLEVVWQGGD